MFWLYQSNHPPQPPLAKLLFEICKISEFLKALLVVKSFPKSIFRKQLCLTSIQPKKFTLNFLRCVESSTQTKKNLTKKKIKKNISVSPVMCHTSHVICYMSTVTCHQHQSPRPHTLPLLIPLICTVGLLKPLKNGF